MAQIGSGRKLGEVKVWQGLVGLAVVLVWVGVVAVGAVG